MPHRARDTDFAGNDGNFFITFVNAMFTTFMRVRFTNVFDVIARNGRRACVWRAGITG
jgi:hypothetical protein